MGCSRSPRSSQSQDVFAPTLAWNIFRSHYIVEGARKSFQSHTKLRARASVNEARLDQIPEVAQHSFKLRTVRFFNILSLSHSLIHSFSSHSLSSLSIRKLLALSLLLDTRSNGNGTALWVVGYGGTRWRSWTQYNDERYKLLYVLIIMLKYMRLNVVKTFELFNLVMRVHSPPFLMA